jgi:hypothetical protein
LLVRFGRLSDTRSPDFTNNTAVGSAALELNATGDFNTACGDGALEQNTTGPNNSAAGTSALESNTSGASNTAVGGAALLFNDTGSNNTAVGAYTLVGNQSGSVNTAIGMDSSGNAAGANISTGSNNIYLATSGSSDESQVIRIGDIQTQTFIAGIRGVTTGMADAVPVLIDSAGQLGTMSSSRRFKTDIHDMGATSSKLLQLHPVTFRYKPDIDPSGTVQYGLIAEEVDKVHTPVPAAYLPDSDQVAESHGNVFRTLRCHSVRTARAAPGTVGTLDALQR